MTKRRVEPASDSTSVVSEAASHVTTSPAADGSSASKQTSTVDAATRSFRRSRFAADPSTAAAADGADPARRLRESESRFRALVEATGQLVWTTSPDGMVVDVPLWRAYTGQTVEQVRGLGWLDAVHPDDQAQVREMWERAIATRTLYEAEYRLRRQDGVYRYFLVRAVPVLAPDGTLREWVGVNTDITERRGLEEAMRRKAQEAAARAAELEATFDAMADGVLMYDAEGTLVRANSRARDILSRYTDPDAQALPTTGGHNERVVLYNSQGEPLAAEEWPLCRILRGETLNAENSVDVRVRRHDGGEMLLSTTGEPLRNADGTVAGAVLAVRDVTERRRVEERTRAALDALLTMAETLVLGGESAEHPSEDHGGTTSLAAQRIAELTQHVIGCRRLGISIIEPETEMLRPIAVVGLPPDQERAWWETEGHEAPLRQQVQPDLLARLEAGELVIIDLRMPPYATLPNPYGVTVAVTAPMRIGNRLVGLLASDYAGAEHSYSEEELALIGAVARLGALVVERDRLLREREESRANELALRATTRRFDEFLSIASHELRTPLTSIRANAQLAARRLGAVSGVEAGRLVSVRSLLTRVDHQTAVLNRLVDDLLDVSRIQANKLEFRFETVNLGTVVRDAVQEQQLTWPGRTISLDVPDEPVRAVADADRISQVVTNFLTNALKYSEEDRPVAVRLTVNEATARVSVRDEGPGLSPAQSEHIWERFHRAEGIRVLAGSGVGLGLGLFISRTIVERHGGRVGVESKERRGSTFWCELPIDR